MNTITLLTVVDQNSNVTNPSDDDGNYDSLADDIVLMMIVKWLFERRDSMMITQ